MCIRDRLGVLMFDNALLAMGNLLFLGGATTCLGISRTISLFTNSTSLKGTAGFVAGLFLLLCGWARIGFIIEVAGLLQVFWGLIPGAVHTLKGFVSVACAMGSSSS
eukprot:TRINITY_DN1123_c0_g1_i1.p1 TRINITY_DN1123_c0_g1~~TRINITY_DN1123_c0_g1_i1.p1  ORF type:complete len:107 (+),score=29.11 TRINITY_DN1123_c0_g1_i1:171-491(+)